MFSFNRKEQLAILILSAALLVGIGVSMIAEMRDGGLPDFRVVKGAVPVPPDTAGAKRVVADSIRTLVNVNTASIDELQTLPRIGPTTAQRIVDHRSRHGRFTSLDDLTLVPGIGSKTLARLRPHITLGPK